MNDTREKILKTAFILFMQKSFNAVTMNEIVNKTGMSKGAFYHYFTSKEKVFEEVVDTYFMTLADIGYENCSHESLQAFYSDLKRNFNEQGVFLRQLNLAAESGDPVNFYLLAFDATRILPGFKVRIMEVYHKELNAWKEIVAIAKKKGEIKTDLSDERIAKLFIHANDGAGLSVIISGKVDQMIDEITLGYDTIYSLLKAD